MDIAEKASSFVEEHPTGAAAALYAGTLAVCIPLCALMYRWLGRTAGKAAAEELLKSGIKAD